MDSSFGDASSLVQKIPCGFSVVGAREEVISWSCQPRLSYSVATRMEPVRFRGLILGCLMYTFIGGADLSVFLVLFLSCGHPRRLFPSNNTQSGRCGCA
ncbi:hypothetical protein Bca4012_004704 [Brassica carinata]